MYQSDGKKVQDMWNYGLPAPCVTPWQQNMCPALAWTLGSWGLSFALALLAGMFFRYSAQSVLSQ
jgi:hypothetical protein